MDKVTFVDLWVSECSFEKNDPIKGLYNELSFSIRAVFLALLYQISYLMVIELDWICLSCPSIFYLPCALRTDVRFTISGHHGSCSLPSLSYA